MTAGSREHGIAFPLIIPKHPAGEAPPMCGDDFAGQLRTFVGVPGYSDGIYRCEPSGSDWEAIASVSSAPTITDFTDAQHDHGDAAGGGAILLPFVADATLGPWLLNDLPGTTTIGMALLYFNTATAVSQGINLNSRLSMPMAGRVIAGFLVTDNARTAGSVTLQVSLNGTPTAFLSGAVALDGTNTIRDAAIDAVGLPFAAGDQVTPVLVSSGWTPITANIAVWLTVRFEG